MQNFHTNKVNNTPQSEKASPNQVANSAGGYSFEVTIWQKLTRFLVLGVAGGSYYNSEKKMAKGFQDTLDACLKEDPVQTIDTIVELSTENRVINNDTAIFAIAWVTASKTLNQDQKTYAYKAVNKICRIPTHYFHFMNYSNDLRGVGMGLRKAIQRYYLNTPIDKLAMHIIKYKQRDGWSHKDLLRLAHPPALEDDARRDSLLRYAANAAPGPRSLKRIRGEWEYTHEYEGSNKIHPQVVAHEEAMTLDPSKKGDRGRLVNLIQDHRLTHEMIPTKGKNYPEVWEALAQDMPLGALLRNLGNLGRVGLLKPLSSFNKVIIEKLSDSESVKRSRLHPFQVLVASKAYSIGRRLKGGRGGLWNYPDEYNSGSLEWAPVATIKETLDDLFYVTFGNIEPTGQRILLGVDVSGSMDCSISGQPLVSCREGAALMAMVTARVEDEYHVMAFANTFRNLNITAKDTLEGVVNKMDSLPFGGTDCGLPFKYAQRMNLEVDAFGVYTDSETWAGRDGHPHQLLSRYRKSSGIPAKSFVVAMVANNFTIADPNDGGMIDFVGFDPNTPRMISDFIKGEL